MYTNGRNVAHGIAGGPASLNNLRFGQGHVGGWRNANTIAFLDVDAGKVSQYDIVSKSKSTIFDHGANILYAGGGIVASWLNSPGHPLHGLSTTTGLQWPDAWPVGASPDGAFAYKPHYHADNEAIRVRELSGADWELGQVFSTELQLLGQQRAIFKNASQRIQTVGIPQPVTVDGPVWNPRAAFIGGQWLIGVYTKDHGLVIHPFDSFEGFSIVPRADAWMEMEALDNDILFISISNTAGEAPGDIWVREINVVTNEIRDPWSGGQWAPIQRLDVRSINAEPAPPATSVHINPLPRKVIIAPYKSYDDPNLITPDYTGNVLFGHRIDLAPDQTMPVIGGEDPVPAHLVDRTIVCYVHGSDIADLEVRTRRALANNPTKPVIAYLDQGSVNNWPAEHQSWMTKRVRLNGQTYRNPGESLAAFRDRGTRMLERIASYGHWFGTTPAFYTRNIKEISPGVWVPVVPVAEILECMPVYEDWFHEFDMLVDFLPFADMRVSGMMTHPIFREWAKAFLDANPGRPSREDYWTPDTVTPPAEPPTPPTPEPPTEPTPPSEPTPVPPVPEPESPPIPEPVPVPEPPIPTPPVPPELPPVPVPEPEPPTPEPPTPPVEESFYQSATQYEVPMTPHRVALRLGQMFASIDPAESGQGPFPGWFPVRFKPSSRPSDPNCAFTISKPRDSDKRLMIRHDVTGAALSADATEFSGDIASQFGGKPNMADADWDGHEAWHGWALGNEGIDVVMVHYDRGGEKYTSACLTVVPL